MIGWLQGYFLQEMQGGCILNVQGVGYQIFTSSRNLAEIRGIKGEVQFYIETHVREDHIHLYGFLSHDEQAMFKTLLSVQGVGAKMALSLLGALNVNEIRQAIMAEDKALLTKADGVGAKLAARMIGELKDKIVLVGGDQIILSMPQNKEKSEIGAKQDQAGGFNMQEDILSALLNLGYGRSEAYGALQKAYASGEINEGDDLAQIISLTLKKLVK